MGKRSRMFEVKLASLRDTLVFETIAPPSDLVEFRFSDLERWGYDLVRGRCDHREAYFLSAVDSSHRVGDCHEEGGHGFEPDEILRELPGESRLMAQTSQIEGRTWLELSLSMATGDRQLARIPAAELLLHCFSKRGLSLLMGTLQDVGKTTTFEHSHGQIGRARAFEEWSPALRHFIHEARDLSRRMGNSRLAMASFGTDKDQRQRFRLSWQLPTLGLLDLPMSEKVERLLASLD